MVTLHTVGHGAQTADDLATLLATAGIELLVDVRAQPGSRRHPQFARGRMEQWLPEHGIEYRWEPALGGRREAHLDSPHTALADPAFRGYADYMTTDEFGAALDGVLNDAARRSTAVMCAEGPWTRCHRKLVADAVVLLRDERVRHVVPDGTMEPHRPTRGVRVAGRTLVYDGGELPLPGTG